MMVVIVKTFKLILPGLERDSVALMMTGASRIQPVANNRHEMSGVGTYLPVYYFGITMYTLGNIKKHNVDVQ